MNLLKIVKKIFKKKKKIQTEAPTEQVSFVEPTESTIKSILRENRHVFEPVTVSPAFIHPVTQRQTVKVVEA